MKYRLMDATGGEGDTGGGASAAPAAAPAAPAAPAAFDWSTSGIDAEAMSVVKERAWKGPADLLTSYRNLEKLTGAPAELIVKLPKGMDPAQMGEVYDKLGRPKSAADYKLAETESDYTKAIAAAMHEAGLNTVQAQALAKKQNEFVAKQNADAKAAYEAQVQVDQTALKAEWKENHDTNMNVARRAANTFGMTVEQINALEQTLGLAGTHKFLYNIGSKLGEAEFVQAGGERSEFSGMSVESARGQLDALLKDRAFIEQFSSKDPAVRGQARAKKERLTKLAYP